MGIFTKDKEEETEKGAAKAVVKAEKKVEPVKIKDNTGRAHRVLRNYHLSEKSNAFSQEGRYVFVVDKATNKIEVKKAVEAVYDVHVTSVNMVNVLGKKRRQGRSIGRTQNWKKAVVTLKSGERITSLAEGA